MVVIHCIKLLDLGCKRFNVPNLPKNKNYSRFNISNGSCKNTIVSMSDRLNYKGTYRIRTKQNAIHKTEYQLNEWHCLMYLLNCIKR
jgi:hypothetical protein